MQPSTLPPPIDASDSKAQALHQQKRLRAKNLAVLAVLIGLVAMFYLIAMVKMSGGAFP